MGNYVTQCPKLLERITDVAEPTPDFDATHNGTKTTRYQCEYWYD